jgi:hypothetical protein
MPRIYEPKKRESCPHCHSRSTPVSCHKCMREMCEDCISLASDGSGKVCGLCADRITGYAKWEKYRAKGGKLDFDDWYDVNW